MIPLKINYFNHMKKNDYQIVFMLKQAWKSKVLKVMRAVIFAVIISVTQVMAVNTYSQNTPLTLDLKNTSIKNILDYIEDNSEFFFIYDASVIDVQKEISIKAKNKLIPEILDEIFRETNVVYKIDDRQIALTKANPLVTASQQTKSVSGKVSDSSGSPLPGVTVVVKGTTQGTVTNANGDYTLTNLPEDATLVFSFVGMRTQEIEIGTQTLISIQLQEDIVSVNEVVVVGAAIKKTDLTGATVSVSEETLQERPVTSINEALQGRAAGVFVQNNPSPGGYASIKIRGYNSMNYGSAPIYVVDGIVMDRAFNMINLDDVASITVLKDASATALYGSRGANGVVLVTTKKGKVGAGKITYDGWFGVQEFLNENLTLNAKDMYELRIDALENAASVGEIFYAEHPGATREDFIRDELMGEGKLWFADYENESYRNGKNYNWIDAVSRAAMQHNHNLSFAGGSEKGNYYVSFGLTDQQGLIKNSDFKKYSGRINIEQFVKPWLKIGTNTSFARTEEKLVDYKVFDVARTANPLLPISDEYLYLAWGNNWDINLENPLRTLWIDRDQMKNRLLSANFVNLTPVNGLNLRTSFLLDIYDQEYYNYIPSNIQQSYRNSMNGQAVHNLDHGLNYQWDNSITYNKTIGKHLFSGLLSMSMSKDRYKYTNVDARAFPIDDFSYYNLGAAYDKVNFFLGSNDYANTLLSYVGRINYEYDKRYMATVTGRYDGSSKFTKDYRWGLFPSIALAWNITEENFLKNNGFLNLAKLRVGYGSVGNQAIPNFATYSLYNPVYSQGKVSFNSTGVMGTKNLKWENQKQLNSGLDLELFNNRLQATAEYFSVTNSNLLMWRSLSSLSGYTSTIENIGEVTNKGVEFTVSGKIIDKQDFSWEASFNISADKNKITKLYGDVDAIYNYGGYTNVEIQRTGNFFLGESLNTIYTYEFDRIIQEEDMEYVNSLQLPGKTLHPGDILPKDQQAEGEEGHGIIDEDDRVIVGKTDPKFYGGFSSRVAWKGLSLNTVFTYKYGSKAISGFYEGLMFGTGYWGAHKDMLDRWTPTNTETNIPRASYDIGSRYHAGETSWGLQNSSFLRLATITLAYDFPKTWTKKAGMDGLRVYASGNNVFCITDYKGYDPENGDWYPTAKMYVFGINFSF